MFGDAFAHHRGHPPFPRGGHLVDVGEREPDLVAPGDHHAVGVENAEAGQCNTLRRLQFGRQARCPCEHVRIGCDLGRTAFGSRRQDAIGREIEPRAQRRQPVADRRQRCDRRPEHQSDRAVARPVRGDARADRRRLCDQLGFRLADELIVPDAEPDETAERKRRDEGEHRRDDEDERRSPLGDDAGGGRQAHGAAP